MSESEKTKGAVTPQDLLQRDNEVVSRKIAGESILVPIRGSLAQMERIFALNPVGQFVWDRLDGSRTIQSIADEVAEHFEVKEGKALGDVRLFVTELVEQGIAGEPAEDAAEG